MSPKTRLTGVFIYTLNDPRTGNVRYVGWTMDKKRRFREHLNRCCVEDTHKARWIRTLVSIGLQPIMCAIEEVTAANRVDREIFWIQHFRNTGEQLTNLTDGGDGIVNYRHTPEAIEKFRTKLRGTPKSVQHRLKLAQARLGTKASAETRAKMSQSRIGRVMPIAAVEKTAQFHRGRKRPESTRAKLRQRLAERRTKGERYRLNETGIVTAQKCSTCKLYLPLDAFNKQRDKHLGISGVCKPCSNARRRKRVALMNSENSWHAIT